MEGCMEKIKDFIKKHRKKLILALIVGAAIFVGTRFIGGGEEHLKIPKTETTQLEKKNFLNSINESGKAVSENTTFIYAQKSLPVKEIKVALGNKVKSGDVIAVLDDSSLQQQLEQKQAQIASSEKTSSISIKTATQQTYLNY